MPKGGSRSRSGPKQDPNALRRMRKDDAEWTTLPAEGRTVPAPDWPLTEATPREQLLWERWWRKPEALIWEAIIETIIAAMNAPVAAKIFIGPGTGAR